MPDITGRCLCGSITYSCSAEALHTSVCHCESCQRQTGTAFSTIVAVPKETFLLEGAEALGEHVSEGDSGKPVRRNFCKNCGSPIFSIVEVVPSLVIIKAGTLDDKSWLEPKAHYWCSDAQPWVEIPEEIQQFSHSPPSK